MMDIKVALVQWFLNFLIKKVLVEPLHLHGWRSQLRELDLQLKMRIFQNSNYQKNYTNQLLENLKKEVHAPFKDNIWGADLADMQLISKFNKGIRFLL